jgi:Outer membrane protein beta-barrel domain
MKKLLIGLAVLASTNVMAQDSKWYVGGELGSSKVDNSTPYIANSLVSQLGGTATATQDSSVGVARIFAGYKVNEMVDLELGYFQSGDIGYRASGVTSGSVAYGAALDVNYSGFDYSVLLRPLTFNDAAKGFFLKFGGHRSEAEANIRVTSGSVSVAASSKDSGSGTLYGLGYDFSFSKNMFGRAAVTEYKKVAGISDNDGTVYSLGLGYKF